MFKKLQTIVTNPWPISKTAIPTSDQMSVVCARFIFWGFPPAVIYKRAENNTIITPTGSPAALRKLTVFHKTFLISSAKIGFGVKNNPAAARVSEAPNKHITDIKKTNICLNMLLA
ncbi:MAG: hypothetical protein A3H69_04315 [Candidatus Sungbacteria bacterium RIFCSPLOWO2_02_FULL_47_9]|uniref:Uncharacterized protein n=1 Tax=Candidatus Sungbacteria bacterium RIFCSPHIGHO2_01_FULL_47_32 TaxID=1802264 RepID=A0A1G2KB07_9BACT|nr:MAG: hypothetical protein UX72_C0052G0004 [Parcubacteria group bacterium GW2011_GWA2_47_10]OGZ95701.1 MAG: hypothetical protein A2633_01845 [Candidatus Sungbacteria bacterium RIFCSPHIGHO2_01_FULL_47_32]OGZ98557.1 MAG: hypothetical protein A3D57_04400 [Candidatus Sungbacteria bacterium RIFCSPHIGHO2_02_FULL_46_12]OHA08702.1 MAG: hypothetical protein A3H69_04315 [Candidatus Sungbacteria bacterium RIFCSPLOWO2_02_FULL_47_9]